MDEMEQLKKLKMNSDSQDKPSIKQTVSSNSLPSTSSSASDISSNVSSNFSYLV